MLLAARFHQNCVAVLSINGLRRVVVFNQFMPKALKIASDYFGDISEIKEIFDQELTNNSPSNVFKIHA